MSSEVTAGQTPDVYGQLHPVETPELLKAKLNEFHHQLSRLHPDETQWATEAQIKCPMLCNDDFKLQFLRCEVFNADLAATRYTSYWKKRVELFGRDRAFLPLTLGAALDDPKIHMAFQMGVVTLMEGVSDPSGRAIVYFDPSKYDKSMYTLQTILPAFWYVLHAALESITAQQKGVVFLGDPGRASLSQFDRGVAKELMDSLRGALPIRLSAFHLMHPPAFAKIVVPVVKLFMSDRMKKRICMHAGKQDEVLEKLETKYGLTKEMLPTTVGGTYQVQHEKWAQKRSCSGL